MDDQHPVKQLAAILFATGFTYLVSLLLGKLLLQSLRVRLSRLEEHFLGFVLGSAGLSSIVFALTAAGQAHRGNFLVAGLLIIALAIRRGAHRFSTDGGPALPRKWKILFTLIYAAFALLYLATALLPEFSADGTGYHVAYAARYLREHHFSRISSFVASYPEGVEMLFLFAFAFGRHTAAAMVHFLFLLVAPFGILAYGRRIGSPQVGVIAALLFFLSPIVGKEGTSAYVDVALASAILAVFLLLEIWRQEQRSSLLAAIGLCAGFAFAVKYPGALAIPYALGAVIFYLLKTRRPFVRPAILAAACALLIAAPWMIKNWIMVRNPVAPFANQLFPNPYFSAWAEKNHLPHAPDSPQCDPRGTAARSNYRRWSRRRSDGPGIPARPLALDWARQRNWQPDRCCHAGIRHTLLPGLRHAVRHPLPGICKPRHSACPDTLADDCRRRRAAPCRGLLAAGPQALRSPLCVAYRRSGLEGSAATDARSRFSAPPTPGL